MSHQKIHQNPIFGIFCVSHPITPDPTGAQHEDLKTLSLSTPAAKTPLPPDSCINEADLAYLSSTTGGMTGREAAAIAANTCGFASIGGSTPAEDTVACMLNDEGIGLTEACATCYGGIFLCTLDRCAQPCALNTSAPECVQCQADQGCTAEFAACTGNIDG